MVEVRVRRKRMRSRPRLVGVHIRRIAALGCATHLRGRSEHLLNIQLRAKLAQTLKALPYKRVRLVCIDVTVTRFPRITVRSPQLSQQCLDCRSIRQMPS